MSPLGRGMLNGCTLELVVVLGIAGLIVLLMLLAGWHA